MQLHLVNNSVRCWITSGLMQEIIHPLHFLGWISNILELSEVPAHHILNVLQLESEMSI